MQVEKFLQSLIEKSKEQLTEITHLKTIDFKTLSWKENSESWSVLECVEHLNRYYEFYIPQIESSISNTTTKNTTNFKSGYLGGYFAKSMLPKQKLNKMKTAKDKNPSNSIVEIDVIDRFIYFHSQLIKLIDQSNNVNINKIRIKTSLSILIRMKLGDAFQFMINHNTRHLLQIKNTLQKQLEV